jgi:hypothetical protein
MLIAGQPEQYLPVGYRPSCSVCFILGSLENFDSNSSSSHTTLPDDWMAEFSFVPGCSVSGTGDGLLARNQLGIPARDIAFVRL